MSTMPLNIQTEKQVRMLHRNHPTLRRRGQDGNAFRVTVRGVRALGDPTPVEYDVFIDTSNAPAYPPRAFVLSPTDDEIFHRNVFNAQSSEDRANGRSMCEICLGFTEDPDQWGRIKRVASGHQAEAVMLLEFLDQVAFVLKNPAAEGAPARSEQER